MQQQKLLLKIAFKQHESLLSLNYLAKNNFSFPKILFLSLLQFLNVIFFSSLYSLLIYFFILIFDKIDPTIKTDRIGVVVFGTGRMGRVRADALIRNPKTTLLYGVDLFEESAKSFAKHYNCEGNF